MKEKIGGKNMKIRKRLFVGSIILLLITTPILVIAGVNENTHPSSLNISTNNSLGTLTVVHLPLYYQWFKYHGINVEYSPPDDNPGYDYYFCEVDGVVWMNFSLTVKHRLNPVKPFFADRYTWINSLYLNDGYTDYFSFEGKELCENVSFETYYINLTEDDQIQPLETNGENVTLTFWLFGMPAVTNSPAVHTLMDLLPCYPINFLKDEGGSIPITIHPIQC